jgi:hypothetical protein
MEIKNCPFCNGKGTYCKDSEGYEHPYIIIEHDFWDCFMAQKCGEVYQLLEFDELYDWNLRGGE